MKHRLLVISLITMIVVMSPLGIDTGIFSTGNADNQLTDYQGDVTSYRKEGQATINSHVYSVGDEEEFDLHDFYDGGYDSITATCKFVGPDVYIFLDNRLAATQNYQEISDRVSNVMLPILEENFASPSDIDNNDKIVILLADIPGVGGYFSPRDFSTDGYYGEIVYINSKTTVSYTTIIHELQHLVHYGFDPYETIWFNEGCSTFSEFLYSYALNDSAEPLSVWYPIKIPLLWWDYENAGQSSDYQSARTFISYLYDRFGSTNLSAIYQAKDAYGNKLHSKTAIMSVVNQYYPEMTFEELYLNWIIANTVDHSYKESDGSNYFWYYENFDANPYALTIPETGLFGRKYPLSEKMSLSPYATQIIRFTEYPDPSDINISITIPDNYQDSIHSWGFTLIKEYKENMTYSEYNISTYYLDGSTNSSEGLFLRLNQTEEGFTQFYFGISLFAGGDGGYVWNMPSNLPASYYITVTSGDTPTSTNEIITDQQTSDNATSPGFMAVFVIITIMLITPLYRRKMKSKNN